MENRYNGKEQKLKALLLMNVLNKLEEIKQKQPKQLRYFQTKVLDQLEGSLSLSTFKIHSGLQTMNQVCR